MIEIPQEVLASAEDLRRMLDDGGRVDVTVRSKRTGAHVKVALSCKKRRPEGERGYVSRATVAGRVGYAAADKIDVLDPDLEWPESKIGAWGKRSHRFYAEDGADTARVWTAEHVILFALGEFPALAEQAEVLVSTRCICCGKGLTHPESIATLIGPECARKRRQGRPAPRRGAYAEREIA